MSGSHEDIFKRVIHALSHATLAATSNGYPGVAYAAIEIQYLITSRIRPGLATQHIYVSSYAVLDYTVRGLEAQVSADLTTTKEFKCAQSHAQCIETANDTMEKTLCLMNYAACIGEYFTAVVEE